jgi:hypothetical protein
MAKALQGDVRAMAALLALHARLASDQSDETEKPIDADELEILRRFVRVCLDRPNDS